ncbi:MAG TPA: RagB/SusD family nutrient uptake outer membrane protein [Puia sp.]|nr:RagB/SusD family nutrient uptake outer membrane protein [Puia sp.]
MTKDKLYNIIMIIGVLATAACSKKQLQVGDPNDPTLVGNVTDEAGLIALAQGGVYLDGFANGDGWLGNSYFSLPRAYLELMADNIGADASNNQITTVGYPTYYILDDGTKIVSNTASTHPQIDLLRQYNILGGSGNNPMYYVWQNMYALNAACNSILKVAPTIKLSGDAASRLATIKAWCYFWKGYAYSQIGTTYFSGLIQDDPNNITNNHYLPKDSILAQSNYYLNLCSTTIGGISSASDFATVLGELIPDFCQVGNGGVLTVTMWQHNINTLLARNILLNKLSPYVNGDPGASISKSSMTSMTSADWNSVLSLATNGIQPGDYVFTGRSLATNGFFTASTGNVGAETTGPNIASTFKIGVRYIANFKPGDQRLAQNVVMSSVYNNPFYGTPYDIVDSLQQSNTGIYVLGNKQVGEYEVIIVGSLEENLLMLAEANIRLGNIDAGLAFVDQERTLQGAGIAPVSGTGLTLAQAMKELTMERRAALIFRGLAYFDARRWGWTYDISVGGGVYGQPLYNTDGTYDTNVTINYNFMDYWDVPADESQLNPPGTGSSPVTNPNY